MENIVSNFESDEEIDMDVDMEELNMNQNVEYNQNNIYNPAIYNFNYVYNYFKMQGILKNQIRCPICTEIMKINKDKSFIDKICFRCKKTNPKHDKKIFIRKDSFIENIRIELIAVYFLLFDCFIFNLSANKSFIESKKFKEIISLEGLSLLNIQNFYRLVRNKIKIKMHLEWKLEKLASEQSIDGIPRLRLMNKK